MIWDRTGSGVGSQTKHILIKGFIYLIVDYVNKWEGRVGHMLFGVLRE